MSDKSTWYCWRASNSTCPCGQFRTMERCIDDILNTYRDYTEDDDFEIIISTAKSLYPEDWIGSVADIYSVLDCMNDTIEDEICCQIDNFFISRDKAYDAQQELNGMLAIWAKKYVISEEPWYEGDVVRQTTFCELLEEGKDRH